MWPVDELIFKVKFKASFYEDFFFLTMALNMNFNIWDGRSDMETFKLIPKFIQTARDVYTSLIQIKILYIKGVCLDLKSRKNKVNSNFKQNYTENSFFYNFGANLILYIHRTLKVLDYSFRNHCSYHKESTYMYDFFSA